MPIITEQFVDTAISTLAGGAGGAGTSLNPADVTLLVQTGDGNAKFPAAGATVGTFNVILGNPSGTYEIVKCTSRTGDSLTITRAQEGTSAGTWPLATTVQAAVTAGSFQALYGRVTGAPLFNVRDYGAKGDGVSDDTSAIAAAISAASAAGGGTVTYPGGTYISTTQTVVSNVYHEGAGPDATIIKLKNATNADLFSAFTANININAASGVGSNSDVSSFGFRNLTLDGNYTNQSSGPCWPLRVYAHGWLLDNVWVKNGYSGGVQCDWNGTGSWGFGAFETTWNNVRVFACVGASTAMGVEWGGTHDSRWSNVLIYNTNGHSLHLGPHASTHQMVNCHFWSSGQVDTHSCGLLAECQFLASNCEIEGNNQALLVALTNLWSFVGGSIFGVDHNGIGVQIGQTAGGTPYTGSANQSAGLTTAFASGTYLLQTHLFGILHASGAISFTNDAGGMIVSQVTADGGTVVSTGAPSNSTLQVLNTRGFSPDPQMRLQMAGGLVAVGQSGTAPDPGNGGTIATANLTVSLVNPAANETGLILAAGTQKGQIVYVYNLGAFTLTFAARATSNVFDGVADIIPAQTCRGFIWEVGSNVWARMA